MRDIRFRGKCKETGQFFHGDLIQSERGTFIRFDSNENDDEPNTSVMVEVIPETVGQYIGLNDVATNPIYDGDIVKHRRVGNQILTTGKVSLSPSQGVIVNHWPLGFDCMVIGNIHDHPHLLEG